MALENYRDLSVRSQSLEAGFQYEFFCTHCDRHWKSAFKPYRMGQIASLFTSFSALFFGSRGARTTADAVASLGGRGAQEKALAQALVEAETRYAVCPRCHKASCADCFDPAREACEPCLKAERGEYESQAHREADEAGLRLSCPQCRTPNEGGRFCGVCGFDLASTQKSCPTCSTSLARDARFCAQCGHGF